MASFSPHLKALLEMIQNNASYAEVFSYGIRFLPQIKNENGKINLDKLNDYQPEIVEFFEVLSDFASLPKELADLATDFAIYANGETVQIDGYYQLLNPETMLKAVLHELDAQKTELSL